MSSPLRVSHPPERVPRRSRLERVRPTRPALPRAQSTAARAASAASQHPGAACGAPRGSPVSPTRSASSRPDATRKEAPLRRAAERPLNHGARLSLEHDEATLKAAPVSSEPEPGAAASRRGVSWSTRCRRLSTTSNARTTRDASWVTRGFGFEISSTARRHRRASKHRPGRKRLGGRDLGRLSDRRCRLGSGHRRLQSPVRRTRHG